MFREEDQLQSLMTGVDDDNDDNEQTSESPLTNLNSIPTRKNKDNSKFFMRATNPTRWIFYKHNAR